MYDHLGPVLQASASEAYSESMACICNNIRRNTMKYDDSSMPNLPLHGGLTKTVLG